MSSDTSPGSKKHRVIAWKPENSAQEKVSTRRLPRWVTVLLATGGALLLVVAILGAVVVYRINKMQRDAVAAQAAANPGANLRAEFVSRSRAEFARGAAMRGLDNVRKTPSDHPAVVRRLIEIERILLGADKAFGDANYALAVQQYDAVAAETKQFASVLEDMRKARQGYDKFLIDVSRLERLKPLAPDKFDAAMTAAGAARTFLDEGSFSLARQKMDEAASTLESIEKSITEKLETSLSAGRSALTQGDGQAAKAAFTQALELQPGNEVAVKGLDRAKTINQVFELNEKAAALEKEEKFEEAQNAFEKAFAIDAQSATAQAGIARMKSSIRERDFNAALAQAKADSEAEKWNDAISQYEAALKLYPDNKDVKQSLAEARVKQREAFITNTLETAYDYEEKHEWNQARRLYLDLLKFEPNQADAEEGLLRTGKVLRALLKFERLIDDARSHAQGADFQSAIAAFNEALTNKPSYLSLTPEQDELRSLLEKQSRPVQVTFVSDNRTYVTIQGMSGGLLGKFEQRTVSILPGNYQIVGRRRGYQDAREVLRVRADEGIPPVTVVANTRMGL